MRKLHAIQWVVSAREELQMAISFIMMTVKPVS